MPDLCAKIHKMKKRHAATDKKAIVSLFASSDCSTQVFSRQLGIAVPKSFDGLSGLVRNQMDKNP